MSELGETSAFWNEVEALKLRKSEQGDQNIFLEADADEDLTRTSQPGAMTLVEFDI